MRRIAIAFALVGCFVVRTAVGRDVQLTVVATEFNNQLDPAAFVTVLPTEPAP